MLLAAKSCRDTVRFLIAAATLTFVMLATSWIQLPFACSWKAQAKEPGAPLSAEAAACRKLRLQGKYAEALERLEKLPDGEQLLRALESARCLIATGEFDKASETLESALKDHPKNADALAELASIHLARGKYEAAEKAADEALESSADHLQARWIKAELKRLSGDLDEANKQYHWFVEYYNAHDDFTADQLYFIGKAAAQYARWNRLSDQFNFLANDLFPDMQKADADAWQARYESGLLFLEKYNEPEAAKEFGEALKINANAAEVHAALARLRLQNFELEKARQHAERALEINPHLMEGFLAQADIELANLEAEKALVWIQKALEENPLSEDALGRQAAAFGVIDGLPDDVKGTRMGEVLEKVDARNPKAGEFYFALGASLDLTRRFPGAAKYYKLTMEKMPQLIESYGALGLMYMRLGDEVQAKDLLLKSFEIDPFNVRVSNSIKVLEVLDSYAVLETEHFVIRFDRAQDELLVRYVAKYLEEEVYPELTKSFGFEPQSKSLFEFFCRSKNTNGHGWFSARMVGLPYIGTVGACAGKMVALASPTDLEQKYNWARVVKHEFVHVLNLQQTNFNIPHWYTEALAVQSEGNPRPQIWNELLAARVPSGELFNLDNINLGFIRPKTGLDWQMAYCQSQLYAQYMLEKYGPDSLAKMLDAYRDNCTTRIAIERSFQVKQEDFEAGYREYLAKIVAGISVSSRETPMTLSELTRALRSDPKNPDLLAKMAAMRSARKNYAEARKFAEQALAENPKHPLATTVMAQLHIVVGDEKKAVEILEGVLDKENPNEGVLALLAGLKLNDKDFAAAESLYQLAEGRSPLDIQWKKSLARVYLMNGDNEKLAKYLEAIASADPDDFTVRKKLQQMANERGDFTSAIKWGKLALHANVADAVVHKALGESYAGAMQFDHAAEEFEVTLSLNPKDNSVRLALGKAYLQLKDPAKARQVLEVIPEGDPAQGEAATLLESIPK